MLGSNYFTFLGLQVHWYGVLIALAVGLSFGGSGYDTFASILLPVTIIAIGSFLFSVAGFVIGAYAGKRISFPVEIIGGIILIGIGVKILVEHLSA